MLQAAAFAKPQSATNSDAGSSKYTEASSDGALDAESDVSFSGDKSDTASNADDYVASGRTSPHLQNGEESPQTFANIFNGRMRAQVAAPDDVEADDDNTHVSSDQGITLRGGASVRNDSESLEIADKSDHSKSSNGHGNGSQNGKAKKILTDGDDEDTQNGVVVVGTRDNDILHSSVSQVSTSPLLSPLLLSTSSSLLSTTQLLTELKHRT